MTSKRIVFVAIDNGMDGMANSRVLYASFHERTRDAMLMVDKSKAYRSTKDVIVDVPVAVRKALAKLDGIDRLVLGLPPWPQKEIPKDWNGEDR